jgi:hypothetical protein
MKKKLHTYDEWLKGDTSSNESLFLDDDMVKIREKQKELIQQAVERRLDEIDTDFEKQVSVSIMPEKLVKGRIQYYESLFFGNKNDFWTKDASGRVIADQKRLRLREMFEMRVNSEMVPDIIEYPDMKKVLSKYPDLEDAIEVEALFKHYEQIKATSYPGSVNDKKELLTTKQQILMLHYLSKYKFFNLEKLNPDISGQARIIRALLNRDEGNVARYLREVRSSKYGDKYFTQENLEAIKEVFQNGRLDGIVNEIEAKIASVKMKKI